MAQKKKSIKKSAAEKSDSGPPNTPPAPKLNLNKNPTLAAEIFERLTVTNNAALNGGELVPRKEVILTIDGSECAPGVFCDENGEYYDFKITLRSLSAEDEISVFGDTDITEDQIGGAFRMAKKSFYKMNGSVIAYDQKDILWECLGPKGRQLVIRGFGQLTTISPAALGKLLSVSPEDLSLEG